MPNSLQGRETLRDSYQRKHPALSFHASLLVFFSGGVVNCEGTEFSVEPCSKEGWLCSRHGKHRSEVAREALVKLASIAAFRSVESLVGSGWSWLAIRG